MTPCLARGGRYGARVRFTPFRSAVGLVAALAALALPAAAFADDPPSPEVTTLAATEVTGTSATLHAKVVTNGTPTTVHFTYGTTPDQLLQRTPDTAVPDGPGEIPVSATITVRPLTKYYVRAVAENADWIVTGDAIDFTSLARPSLTGAPPSDVTHSSGTIHVKVVTSGQPVTITGQAVQTSPGGAVGAPIKLGPVTVTADGDVPFPLTGTLRTFALLPTPPVSVTSAPVKYGTDVAVKGVMTPRVLGTTVAVTLVEQPFPFTAPIAPVAGVAPISTTGPYAFTVKATRPTSYGVVADGFRPVEALGLVKVKVFPAVTVKKPKRAKRHRFVISGAYQPAGVVARASLYRRVAGGGAVKVGLAVRTTGSFTFPARTWRGGKYEVRIVPAAGTGWDAARSAAVTVPRR
jgi:hypothetical protein